MFRLRITGDLGFEFWKDIEGYEGIYQISTYGRLKSLQKEENGHYRNGDYNVTYTRKEHISDSKPDKEGYFKVALRKNGKYYYTSKHILVGKAFIPNFNNKPFIDHILPVKNGGTDRVENLHYVTSKENINNPITVKNKLNTISWCYKRVICFNENEKYEFESIKKAADFFKMKSTATITNVLCGKAKTGYGFKWVYAQD